MTVSYIVLGVVVMLVGVGQIYFRHFVGGRSPEAAEARRQSPTRRGTVPGRVGQTWTGIVGFIGIALGMVLLVLGVLGH